MLKHKGNKYYNYIIMGAAPLYSLLERFDTDGICGLGSKEITLQDVANFKDTKG